MPTIRCGACGAENTLPQGGGPVFCASCHEIVDSVVRRKPTPAPEPGVLPTPDPGSRFVSAYGTRLRDATGPGAGFAVGGSRILGYLLAVVAAALVGGGLAWLGAHVLYVPILFSLLAGWAVKRALAAGSGGGTPDRGLLGSLFLLAIVLGTFVGARFVEYLFIDEEQSRHYGLVFGPSPLADPDAAIRVLYSRDPDKDGQARLEDGTTVNVGEEEQRLRAAVATGRRHVEGYDIALLRATGRTGFPAHLEYMTTGGTTFRFVPKSQGVELPGYAVILWWIVELAVLGLAAFARVD